ncbi:hypothetical protein AVEN_74968-1 [Araneus ventricosus]|uniref:Uncharacterized protein n=1 Tax=Araneus ventricosus TaxID=182803 RepID=A0A4Y2MDL4_ARAVE|nr:hypothetical protein AVEN_74968-1 [Araneus ventricosus]
MFTAAGAGCSSVGREGWLRWWHQVIPVTGSNCIYVHPRNGIVFTGQDVTQFGRGARLKSQISKVYTSKTSTHVPTGKIHSISLEEEAAPRYLSLQSSVTVFKELLSSQNGIAILQAGCQLSSEVPAEGAYL